MQGTRSVRWRAEGYVLAAALLWSTGGLGVKSVQLSPMGVAGLRSAFAAPILGVALYIEARRRSVRVGPMLRRPLVWAAAFSYAVMVVSFVVACKLTTAANAILLQYTGPVYVALLSWPLLRERVRASDVMATLGCLLGMVLIVAERVSGQGHTGDLVAILSSWGFAGVPLLMRLDARSAPAELRIPVAGPLLAMVVGNVMACLVCAPFMAADLAHPVAPDAWATLAFLGIFQIGVAYVLYGAAVNAMPALRSTLLAMIEPVLNPLWVALVRGERPSGMAAAGGLVILGSVTLQAAMRRRPVSS